MTFQRVNSGFIHAYLYDETTRVLVIEFKRTGMVAYGEVPPEVVVEFFNHGQAAGVYFNREIRDRYPLVPIPGTEPE